MKIVDDTYKIKDLDQVRLLSDPLKLQLLQAFAEGDKTTKQVATELDESVTKLYRHVDALHDAGLLEVVQETQKRGTVERTFRAVAKRFEADSSLFLGDAGGDGSGAARDLLRAAETEILQALAKGDADNESAMIVTRFRAKGSPARIAELRRSLTEWIESVQEVDCAGGENTEEVGALIAFYPIEDETD